MFIPTFVLVLVAGVVTIGGIVAENRRKKILDELADITEELSLTLDTVEIDKLVERQYDAINRLRRLR